MILELLRKLIQIQGEAVHFVNEFGNNQILLFSCRDDDPILIQTETIDDNMIDSVEEIIEENPRQSPSTIIVLVIEITSKITRCEHSFVFHHFICILFSAG